jgi:hypothetical protein
MRLRFLSLFLLVGLATTSQPVRALAADSAKPPTLVVRLRPIDGLLEDLKYLTRIAGPAHEAKLDEELKKHFPAGLRGVDTKRPIGLYGKLDDNLQDSSAVLLVPISDEKAFLELLSNFHLKATKEEGDSYAINPEKGPPVYLRFANGYVYASIYNKEAIDVSKLLDPARIFTEKHPAAFSAAFRIDQIPTLYQQVALGQTESRIADAADQKSPNETEKQRALKKEAAKGASQAVGSLLKDGAEITVRLDVDRSAQKLSAEFGLRGRPGSGLASRIAALGKSESLFGGLLAADSAMNFAIHGKLPEELRQKFASAVIEAVEEGLRKETDETKRAIGTKVSEAIKPSLQMGELDLGATLRGPTAGKHYTFVGGLKVKEGYKLDAALRDALKMAPDPVQAMVKLDAESAGDVKIHQIDQIANDDKVRSVLGDNPAFVAFRDDALLVAAGEGGLAALKEALGAKPAAAPLVHSDVSASRMGPLIAAVSEESNGKRKLSEADVQAALENAFGSARENDRIRFAVEGGEALTLKITVVAPVAKFLHLLDTKSKESK